MRRRSLIAVLCSVALISSSCGSDSEPAQEPPGREESAHTEMLETGSTALQSAAPLGPMNVYVAGLHPMKDDPAHQVEAHHFCNQVNEDFAQCVLFDGNTVDANLTGIEYIISEQLFDALPEGERQYWHPHNYEILSGQLVAPGLPDVAELELMESKMNSYGKTWHTWRAGTAVGEGDSLPLGEAMLAWSFNRDGEVHPDLLQRHQAALEIDPAEKRRQRAELVGLANPQHGVDALSGAFGETRPVPGVEDATDTAPSSEQR